MTNVLIMLAMLASFASGFICDRYNVINLTPLATAFEEKLNQEQPRVCPSCNLQLSLEPYLSLCTTGTDIPVYIPTD